MDNNIMRNQSLNNYQNDSLKNPLAPILAEQTRLNKKLIDNTDKLIEKINKK